jgi:hypothetical protein
VPADLTAPPDQLAVDVAAAIAKIRRDYNDARARLGLTTQPPNETRPR